jgi:hypothetical protein
MIPTLLAPQMVGTPAHSQERPSEPTVVMVVVLENHNGKKTIETTPISESACRHAVRVFNEVGPFNITVRSPDRKDIAISGRAIEVQCVLSDGSVVAPIQLMWGRSDRALCTTGHLRRAQKPD